MSLRGTSTYDSMEERIRGAPTRLYVPKHVKPLPANDFTFKTLHKSKGRTAPTFTPEPTSQSPQILASFPPEIISSILKHLISFRNNILTSNTRKFIPLQRLAGVPFSSVCQTWRLNYWTFMLGSRSNRDSSAYIGLTTAQLRSLREWFPEIAPVGCLLFIGDPNDFLLADPKESLVQNPSLDSQALNAVEAVEWAEVCSSETVESRVPRLEKELLEVAERLSKQTEGVVEDTQQLMVDEIISLSMGLCSKILTYLDLFPAVKVAEIPSWVLLFMWGIPSIHTRPLSSHLAELLGVPIVSPQDLEDQFKELVARWERMNVVGYHLCTAGIFLPSTNYDHLAAFLVDNTGGSPGDVMYERISAAFAQRFNDRRLRYPVDAMKHLRGIGFRSSSTTDLYHGRSILEKLLYMLNGLEALSEVCLVNSTDRQDAIHRIFTTLHELPLPPNSQSTLTTLILHINFSTHFKRSFCSDLKYFPDLFPNLHHLEITVPRICRELFREKPGERLCRSRVRGGTFYLTVRPRHAMMDECNSENEIYDHRAGTGELEILHLADAHYEEMKDWDIQIRIEGDYGEDSGELRY
ncbi:hypothetical protein CC2G_005169 [Coprinopsis cinerea AmutBmut pab1-1]|nr:hypothetical protein CC2G_005169 [Coprinopsis cinerea AmutBmut pab1-1]